MPDKRKAGANFSGSPDLPQSAYGPQSRAVFVANFEKIPIFAKVYSPQGIAAYAAATNGTATAFHAGTRGENRNIFVYKG